jgi:transcriptional regulator with XRE-family HTH domain
MFDPDWFGGRLRELREGADLSQVELARRVGMTKDGLARLERGERKPSWDTVAAICQALKVDCTAFAQPPAEREPSGPGRPRTTPPPDPEAPKRPRGRPRKQDQIEQTAPAKKPRKGKT